MVVGALLYLNTVWLRPYKEMFVSVWTDKYLNFGNHTTNRVESQHAKTKRYLDTAQLDIAKSVKRIDEVVNSQYTAIRESIGNDLISARHRFTLDEELRTHFRNLCHCVSIDALEIIFKEYERSKYVGPIVENCGCHVRACYGLPCAHEQAIFLNNARSLPLESVDKFWKKLNLSPCTPLTDDCTPLTDDNITYEVLQKKFDEKLKSQSRFGKLSLLKKFQNIISPSTTSVGEPSVQKNTRGRPSLKNTIFRKTKIDLNQNPQAEDPPNQDPPSQNPRRSSISTYTPDYVRSNSFDLNQEPDRHNSCFNHGQPIYYSDPLMNEISIEFQPYVSNIVNVKGDGNCGFRAIAVALGYNENYWRQIRNDLSDELLEHPIEYAMLYEEDLNNLRDSLNFYGSSGAPRQHWLIMPPTGFLIANKYGRIVHLISKHGSSTIFPLWHGPQDIPHHEFVVLAHVQGNHYMKIDLQEAFPLPPIWYLWHQHKSSRSAGWETFYAARLNAYILPYVPQRNYNIPPTVLSSDNY